MIDCKTERMILKSKAVQNELTLKPPTISEHNNIIAALITKRNKPKVMMVTGSVNNTISGFTKILSNPKTTATMTDVVKLATVIPGIK